METRPGENRLPDGWWTVILVGAIAVFFFVTGTAFAGTFRSYVPVTVTSDRSGLVMEAGAKVKMRGVQVGRVADIGGGQGTASLRLEIDPAQIRYIPANVGAKINSTTVFGAKFVDLVYPAAKLNAVLTAVADGVRGQGPRMGEATTDLNQVLQALNERRDTIRADWRSFKNFNDTYAVAAPDIVAILNSASTVSSTIADRSQALDTLMLNTIGFAQSGHDLLESSGGNLVRAANILEPTTALLLKYNPVYTCWLKGATWTLDNGGYEAWGGKDGKSAVFDIALLLGNDPYQYPDNLPIVGAKGGPGGQPGCGSLPDVTKNFPVRELVTNTGWGTGLDLSLIHI